MADILGLSPYYQKNGTKQLLAVLNVASNNSDLLSWDGSSWTSVSGGGSLITDCRYEFCNFIDKSFIVGSTTSVSPTWATPAVVEDNVYRTSDTSLTGMPNAKYTTQWRDLIWLANLQISNVNYPSRIFYSNPVVSNEISWTSTNWIDIDVDDGDELRGVAVNPDRLLCFKEFSLYRYDQNSMIRVPGSKGTTAYRSIKDLQGYTLWFNREGVYRYGGGLPELISGPVQPYIDGMTSSVYNVCAEVDDHNYRLFIGTTVVDGETHNKVWLNYNINLDNWSVDKTADTALVTCNFIDSNYDERIYYGTDTSIVYKKADKDDTVYSDQYIDTDNTGVPIQAEFQTRNFDGGVPELKKYINKITLFFDKVEGVNVSYSIDNTQHKPISSLNKIITEKKFSATAAHFINFKVTENSKNPPFIFNGLVIQAKQEVVQE